MKCMRIFHNKIKENLIEKYAKGRLLDLGVGRGGDMHKWKKCGIEEVIGVDISKEYVYEAIRRYKTCYKNEHKYKFYYMSENEMYTLFLQKKNISTKFDTITSMFSFHYFCKSDITLDNILRQISESLNKGGYFIGTCPDGDKIEILLGNESKYEDDVLYIEKVHNMIRFMLIGTLYFGEEMLSEEFLVYKEWLVNKAKSHGLELVEMKSFETMYDKYNIELEENIKRASFLNMFFVFKKV